MSTISISIPEDDLLFLRRFTDEQGLTIEGIMAQHAINLRRNLEAPLHPDIVAATGTFQTTPQLAEYYDDQERKHS